MNHNPKQRHSIGGEGGLVSIHGFPGICNFYAMFVRILPGTRSAMLTEVARLPENHAGERAFLVFQA